MDNKNIISINILDLYLIIKDKFLLFIAVSFISFFVSYISISFLITEKYKSTSILSVTEVGSATSASIGGFAGIASMAGINIGSESNKANKIVETIRSKDFLDFILNKYNLYPQLAAAKSYDATSKEIIYKSKMYNKKNNEWNLDRKKRSYKPTLIRVHEDFYIPKMNFYINKMNNFIYLEFQHPSPEFSKSFLDILIKELNYLFRIRDEENASKYIDFLYLELEKTNEINVKDKILDLIELKMDEMMLANVTEEYALEIIDNPYVPEEPFSPRKFLLSVIFTIFCNLFILIYFIYKRYMSNSI